MDTDVIVVGAGPVGLMLAAELRLGGARVIVLERLAAPTTESRASTLHARTMEIFDQRGLLPRLGRPPAQPTGHFGGIPLDFSRLSTGFPAQYKVLQGRVERLLGRWATRLGAEVRRRHTVREIRTDADLVTVRADRPSGPVELTARYVVGCDGEDSTVRAVGGFRFPGVPARHELLRADVEGIRIPDRRFERRPNGLAISSRRPDGVTRVMMSTFDRPVGQRPQPPAFDEICKVWELITGEDIRSGTPIWRNAFGDASRLARRYRRGRVLLAGDAAHCQMPSGGQAINLGLQDAVNLGWKLAADVTGAAPAGLLDTYHRERHEVGRQVLANIRAQGLLLLGGPEVEAIRAVLAELMRYPAVNDRLAGMISGIDVRYRPGRHPLVGARVPAVGLTRGRARTTLAALLRPGRGVLLELSGHRLRTARIREHLAPWAGRVDLVEAAPPADGPLAGVDTVLLRPDGHVAWAGGRRSDPRPHVSRWFGGEPH
jgi:2-polyprenyl-6-methoxyphenol hydroxylase-like FAD-dependent oxidoreductase